MSGQTPPDVAQLRRRLMIMATIDGVCVLVALAAMVGAWGFHVGWMLGLFVPAVVVGFGAQVWLVLGLRQGKTGPEVGG
jgi:hypothetical protein